MKARSLLYKNCFRIAPIFFFTLLFMLPTAYGQQQGKVRVNIEKHGDKFNLDVKDTKLINILTELEEMTGITFAIDEKLKNKNITARFEDADIEDMVSKIVGRDNYHELVFSWDPSGKGKLNEIRASGVEIGSIPLEREIITINIPYGSGKEEVGAIHGSEGSSIGPQSFAVDEKGKIYICDSVNNRVQIYSKFGKYISTIPLRSKNDLAFDIAVDESGFVYVYDGALSQYSPDGKLVSTVKVGEISVRTSMQLIGDEFFMGTSEATLIGRILPGNVIKASIKEIYEGQLSINKHRYRATKISRGKSIEYDVKNMDGVRFKKINIPLKGKGLRTRNVLGEDGEANLYLLTRRVINKTRLREIDKFNTKGEYKGTIQMPGGTYHFWTAKDNIISKNGAIYSFIPEKDQLTLHIVLGESEK